MDSREWLITDNHFGMANVNWSETIRRVQGLRKKVRGEEEEEEEEERMPTHCVILLYVITSLCAHFLRSLFLFPSSPSSSSPFSSGETGWLYVQGLSV